MKHFKEHSPMLVALIGPPGAGKGTQLQLLQEKLGWPTLSASAIIQNKLNHGDEADPLIQRARLLYKSGQLVTPSIVAQWGRQEITKLLSRANKGVLMEGFLRTEEEARLFLPYLIEIFSKKNIHVVFISISAAETIKRNSQRRTCVKCKKPAPIDLPKSVKKCPFCGGKLEKRELDDPQIIRTRLQVFKRDTQPAIEFLKQEGVLITINGERPASAVLKDILTAIKS